MQRISFNVNAEMLGDKQVFLNTVKRIQPTWLLLMSDWGLDLAREITAMMDGKTNIVVRFPSETEHESWKDWGNIGNSVAAWKTLEGYNWPNIFFYVLNEPANDPPDVQPMLEYCIEFMNVLRNNGMKGVMANTSPRETWMVDSGIYDRYIRELSRHQTEGHMHIAGWHEYGMPDMAGNVGWPAEWMLEYTRNRPELWPTRDQVKIERINGILPPFWYFLRCAWVVNIRAQELGLPPILSAITEWGWDDMSNVEWLYNTLEQQFGYPEPYWNIRGINTYEYVWKYYWPEWDKEQAAFEQLKWADMVYPANILGMMLFSWTYHPDWDSRYGFNYAPLTKLHGLLEQYNLDHGGSEQQRTVIQFKTDNKPGLKYALTDAIIKLRSVQPTVRVY